MHFGVTQQDCDLVMSVERLSHEVRLTSSCLPVKDLDQASHLLPNSSG